MKHFLFSALLLLMGVTASAQYYEGTYSNSSYEYAVDPQIDLTGAQWHLASTSILAAANNLYLIVNGPQRFVRTLNPLNVAYYERLWRCQIASFCPYYHNGVLGWYIVANLINYFVYPDGHWVRLSCAPRYYSYRYDIAHRHWLNFRNWHFWRHHHPNHYHKPSPPPCHFYDRPHRNHHNHPSPRFYENRPPVMRKEQRFIQHREARRHQNVRNHFHNSSRHSR